MQRERERERESNLTGRGFDGGDKQHWNFGFWLIGVVTRMVGVVGYGFSENSL